MSHSDSLFVPVVLSAYEAHAIEIATAMLVTSGLISPQHPAMEAAVKISKARQEKEANG